MEGGNRVGRISLWAKMRKGERGDEDGEVAVEEENEEESKDEEKEVIRE